MARGRKPSYYEVDTPADFLLHVIDRPEWKKHHKYECLAIQKVLDENRRLKLPWYKRLK